MMLTYSECQLFSMPYVPHNELPREVVLTHTPEIDVPDARDGINLRNRDPDIHISGRLWLRRRVRRSFFTFFITLNCCRYLCSVMDSDLERGRHGVLIAKRMPVAHVACEPHPTSQSATLFLNTGNKPQGLSAESL